MGNTHTHTAAYDDEGNIILPGEEKDIIQTAPERSSRVHEDVSAALWNVIEEVAREDLPAALPAQDLLSIRTETKGVLSRAFSEVEAELSETKEELSHALEESKKSMKELPTKLRRASGKTSRALSSPLSFGKKKKPQPHSKTFLFMVDTIRFGGTFAAIFLLLFVGINAPSFWSITKAQLALGEDVQTVQNLRKLTEQSNDPETVTRITQQDAMADAASLISALPLVGPPENRLVIPTLGENIPIVDPPTSALLKEDWNQFEKDIQGSLQKGVVHYPGTAKPGQAGNFFLTGHSSYYPWDPGKYKEVFARLNELSIGDEYSVYYGGDLHTYRVTKKVEVKPSNVSVLDQPTDKRIATLMTCTPVGTTLRRLIVQAEEIDPVTKTVLHVGEHSRDDLAPAKMDVLPI